MRRSEASVTAALVAVARGLGRLLPPDARLIDDPFGERLATPGLPLPLRHPLVFVLFLRRLMLSMQVRTRLIDDALLEFVDGGGRQVLLLGAGYDCRALRFADRLAGARVFEVDHPATQARKRALLGDPARVTWLAWDFERRPFDGLAAELSTLQHTAARPTLAIWEGVSMYLHAPAVDAAVRALSALSAPGSLLVFTYMDRDRIRARGLVRRARRRWLAAQDEPVIFGFDPQALPAWLVARGFELERDVSIGAAAQTLLPAHHAAALDADHHHVAWARRVS